MLRRSAILERFQRSMPQNQDDGFRDGWLAAIAVLNTMPNEILSEDEYDWLQIQLSFAEPEHTTPSHSIAFHKAISQAKEEARNEKENVMSEQTFSVKDVGNLFYSLTRDTGYDAASSHDDEVRAAAVSRLGMTLCDELHLREKQTGAEEVSESFILDVMRKVRNDWEQSFREGYQEEHITDEYKHRLYIERDAVMNRLDSLILQFGILTDIAEDRISEQNVPLAKLCAEASELYADLPRRTEFEWSCNDKDVKALLAKIHDFETERGNTEAAKAIDSWTQDARMTYVDYIEASDKDEELMTAEMREEETKLLALLETEIGNMKGVLYGQPEHENGQTQEHPAEDKTNSMKEGTTMAWDKKQEQAAPQQSGWGQQPAQQAQAEPKQESMAYISQKTREAMQNDPALKDMAFKLLDVAKQIGEDIKAQGLTTTHKDNRDGTVKTNKFVVSVQPATKYNKDTKENEPLLHKDGTPILSPTISHTVGGTTLTIFAKEDMSNGVRLSSLTAQHFDRQANRMETAKGSEIQASAAFNVPAKKVAARIMEAGFIREEVQLDKIPDEQKTTLMRFAEYAKEQFAGGEQFMREDGTTKPDAYALYKPDTGYGESVQLRSSSTPNIVVEVSYKQDEQYGQQPVARATNFDVKLDNGRFASMYINTASDLDRQELAAVPTAIKQAVYDFKEFDQRQQQREAPQSQKETPKRNQPER